VVQNQTKTEL